MLVSLCLLTYAPHLVVYRLIQPPATAAAISSDNSTEYCAELLAAGVPLDAGTLAVASDMDTLVAYLNAHESSSAAAERQQQLQRNKLAGGIVGGGVGGALFLLLVLVAIKLRAISGTAVTGHATARMEDADGGQLIVQMPGVLKKQNQLGCCQ